METTTIAQSFVQSPFIHQGNQFNTELFEFLAGKKIMLTNSFGTDSKVHQTLSKGYEFLESKHGECDVHINAINSMKSIELHNAMAHINGDNPVKGDIFGDDERIASISLHNPKILTLLYCGTVPNHLINLLFKFEKTFGYTLDHYFKVGDGSIHLPGMLEVLQNGRKGSMLYIPGAGANNNMTTGIGSSIKHEFNHRVNEYPWDEWTA